MLVWITREILVDTDRIVAVVDGEKCNHGGEGAAENKKILDSDSSNKENRTVLIMNDGKFILTKLRKESVIKRLKEGRLNGTGVDKIGC